MFWLITDAFCFWPFVILFTVCLICFSSNLSKNSTSNQCNRHQLDLWSILVSDNVYIAIDSKTARCHSSVKKSVQFRPKLSGSSIYHIYSFSDKRKRNEKFSGNWSNFCDDFRWHRTSSQTSKSNNATRIYFYNRRKLTD